MAGFVPQETINQIMQTNDIVSVIGEYVQLKKRGKDFVALCPFHKEKTPSFYVSPSKQIFKCFGCGEGGNVISFVMAYEKVAFHEALKTLAKRTGIQLNLDKSSRAKTSQFSRFKKINNWATAYFQKNLVSPTGKQALEYVKSRKITPEIIEAFRLGYAQASKDDLTFAAGKAKFNLQEVAKAGLSVESSDGRGYRDRFSDKLMFPIANTNGDVIAFGARALKDEQPKYVNSPESPLFNKSQTLYGLDRSIEFIKKERRALIVEGYIDCIMLYQFGIKNVCATLGTALTEHHIAFLRRYADTLILIFDGDEAGQRAADRAVEKLIVEDITSRIAVLSEGFDPSDFLLEYGAEAFYKIVKNAVSPLDFKLSYLRSQYDMNSIKGQTDAIRECVDIVSKTADPIRRQVLTGRIAEALHIDPSAIIDELRRSKKIAFDTAKTKAKLEDPRSKAEKELLQAALMDASCLSILCNEDKTNEIVFENKRLKTIFETILNLCKDGVKMGINELVTLLQDTELGQIVTELVFEAQRRKSPEKQFDGAMQFIKKDTIQKQINELYAKRKKLHTNGAYEEEITLTQELFKLKSKLEKI